MDDRQTGHRHKNILVTHTHTQRVREREREWQSDTERQWHGRHGDRQTDRQRVFGTE